VFGIPGIANFNRIKAAKSAGAKFIRFGSDVNKHLLLRDLIVYAKQINLEVSANLMKSYAMPTNYVSAACQDLEKWGCDAISVVDSAGTMVPTQVSAYVKAIKEVIKIPIGFHGHNNLQLAIANSVAAVNAGAEIVDGTIRGIGRSSGNAQIDILISVLEKEGFATTYDKSKLSLFGDLYLAQSVINVGIDRIEVECGISGMHSSFVNQILSFASKYELDPAVLINEVAKQDKIDVTEKLIEDTCLKHKKTEVLNQSVSPDALHYMKTILDPEETTSTAINNLLIKAKQNNLKSFLIVSQSTVKKEYTKKFQISKIPRGFILNIDISPDSFSDFIYENKSKLNQIDVLGFDLQFNSQLEGIYDFKKSIYFRESDIEAGAINSFILQAISYKDEICFIYDKNSSKLYRNLIDEYSANFTCFDISEEINTFDVLKKYRAVLIEGSSLQDKEFNKLNGKIEFIFSYMFSENIKALVGTNLIRLSGRKYMDEYISALIAHDFQLDRNNYRLSLGEHTLVSGGLIGEFGDVIVDDAKLPTDLYGVSDGKGNFRKITKEELQNLSKLYEMFSINKFNLKYFTD